MQELSRHELEVLTEAANAVYQGDKDRYAYDSDKIEKKHIFDADKPHNKEVNPDYIKLFNSDDDPDEKKFSIYYRPNQKTGFKYAVYQSIKDKNDIILAFAGTDFPDVKDICNDLEMAVIIPEQTKEALNAYAAVKEIHRGAKITIVGHSLGGSLAQIVGAISGEKTVTFNPYGVKRILWSLRSIYVNPNANYDNIMNYRMEHDILQHLPYGDSDNILGTTYIVEGGPTNPIDAHQMLYYIIDGKKYSTKEWEEKQRIEKLKKVYKKAEERLKEIEKNFDKNSDKTEQIERFKMRIEYNLNCLNTIPISDIPEIKNSSLIKSIDKINEILNSISYNTLVQSTSKFRQIIPTFSKITLNTDYNNNNNNNNSCINIIKKLQDSYNTFNNRDYEKELIKEADRVIREARRLEREELKQEIKQEIMKEIMRAYKEALYRSQGMTDERFNAIMTYISEQLKEALRNRSFYKKYYLPNEI